MVAFPIEEAKAVLTRNISAQENTMNGYEEDLEYLREQITTMEVNIGIFLRFSINDSTNIQLGRKTTAAGQGDDG